MKCAYTRTRIQSVTVQTNQVETVHPFASCPSDFASECMHISYLSRVRYFYYFTAVAYGLQFSNLLLQNCRIHVASNANKGNVVPVLN
jgi:hypothetical protein